MRFSFAIFTSLLIIIGAELSSPNYSATTLITEKLVENSETLKLVIKNNWLENIFIEGFDSNKALPIYSGDPLKLFIFLCLIIFTSLHFLSNDPLSNGELLRNIVNKEKNCHLPVIYKLMDEVHYYARHLPSNKLPNICEKCITEECGNRLLINDDNKSYRWNSIFAELPASKINDLLWFTYKCRYIFLLRYSVWISATALIPIYMIARLLEWKLNKNVDTNESLMLYILLLMGTGIIIGLFNSANDENNRGIWGQFSENINNLFESTEFKKVYISNVCKHDEEDNAFTKKNSDIRTPSNEIQRLITIMDFLDNIVKQKVKQILTSNKILGDRNSLRSILMAMIEMLHVINQEKIRFRCALFVKRQSHLIPLVDIPFDGQPFLTLKSKEHIEKKLLIDKDSVASRAWKTESIISADKTTINYFHNKQEKYLKSMIAIPLLIDNDIQNSTTTNDRHLDKTIGIITIDCDNDNYFSDKNQSANLIEITPFINRIILEMIYSFAWKK
ncbi:MAG: hypothetical protein PHE17_12090 [Thiothrix sp.]|uniref:hypothetical protein n=1 Tax=Thiothrix sp. TaxID=1032 RepID=UPI0026178614|nr:hypothetical protein [Thiothrix sp.]MDD5393750.1 hypothetical protein [Thiothrix sp.]